MMDDISTTHEELAALRERVTELRMELHALRAQQGAAAVTTANQFLSVAEQLDASSSTGKKSKAEEEQLETLEGCSGADLQPLHIERQLSADSMLPIADSKVLSGTDTPTRSLTNDGDGVFSLYGFREGAPGGAMRLELYRAEGGALGLRWAHGTEPAEGDTMVVRSAEGGEPSLKYRGIAPAAGTVDVFDGYTGEVVLLSGAELTDYGLEFYGKRLTFERGVLSSVEDSAVATIAVAECGDGG